MADMLAPELAGKRRRPMGGCVPADSAIGLVARLRGRECGLGPLPLGDVRARRLGSLRLLRVLDTFQPGEGVLQLHRFLQRRSRILEIAVLG